MIMSVHLTADRSPGRTMLVMDQSDEHRTWSSPEELERVLRVLEAFPSRDDEKGYVVKADFRTRAILVYHSLPTATTGECFLILPFDEALRMNLRELGAVIGRSDKEKLK